MKTLIKGCGVALVCGGALLILVNTFLTPRMAAHEDEALMRTSTIYLVRLSAAGVVALLLLFGTLGVHLAQRAAAGALGAVAFLAAFVGSALLVAVEWSNVFVLRAVAQTSPEALAALDGSTLLNVGFASAAGLFALGWLLLAISAWRAGVIGRLAPLAAIAGLFLIPLLAATPLGMTGAIVGNAVLGLGLMGMGRGVVRAV